MDNFCIKPSYRARSEAETLVGDISDYWTAARQGSASVFQWGVYALAGEHLRTATKSRFADVGCGYPAKIQRLIEPHSEEITLIDQPSMAPLVATDFPDYRFLPCDLENAQLLQPGAYDCVVCADVVEHLLDPTGLFELLRRMVSKGGLLFISTPERDRVRGQGCTSSPNVEHVREWNQAEFRALLERSGLQVLQHSLLPQKRIAKLVQPLLPALARLAPAQYAGCQLAICRVQ